MKVQIFFDDRFLQIESRENFEKKLIGHVVQRVQNAL